MLWNELYNKENEPTEEQISGFTQTSLWDDLTDHLKQNCKITPKLSFSNCSMDKGLWKGWNVKYKKRGKALCTLYPKQGYFLALIPIGSNELAEADLLVCACSEYTQNIYANSKSSTGGKSLAMEITNKDILSDVKTLLSIRAKTKLL